MKFLQPKANGTFLITSAPDWPSIEFETDVAGPHTWIWTLTWRTFRVSGTESTPGNKWNAKAAITNYGGTLSVRAQSGKATAAITALIKGANPSVFEIGQYLARKSNSAGFEKIIAHESKNEHFNKSKEPKKSFDNGFGMCQLTTPKPSFDKVWNWQLNVDAGLKLFEQKRLSAVTYLSQSGRTYTAEQLKYETVCRWNGGSYHEWNTKAGKWERQAHILCDTQTGNIGWDMNDADNKGKTEKELHKRDSGSYSQPRQPTANWRYLGVCYADRVLV